MKRVGHAKEHSSDLQSGMVVIFVLCTAAAIMEGIDIQSTGLVAPQYGREFALTKAQLGWVFGLNNFGTFIGSIIAGWATDRLGRRYTAIASMIFFGIFSVGGALAPSGLMFTALRLLIGVGIGGSLANIIAIMAEAGSMQNRAVRVTVMAAAVAVGGAIPGAIVAHWPDLDWRIIYHIGGWLPIAVGLAMLRWLPESIPYLKAKSAALAAPAPSVGSGFAGLFTEGRAKLTLILWIASFGAFLIYYVANNWLPSLVEHDYGVRQASLASVLFTSGGAVGTVLLGLLLGRARQLAVVLSFAGCVAAVCALALVESAGLVLPMAFALGAFATAGKNMMYGFAPLYYPVTMRGAGVGVAVAWGRIGSIVGPTAAGILLGGGGNTQSVLLSLVPIIALAMVATLALSWLRMPEPE